jgi:hypothetical protein
MVAHPMAKACRSGTFKFYPSDTEGGDGNEGLVAVVETAAGPPAGSSGDASLKEALTCLEALSNEVKDEQAKLLSTVEDSVRVPTRCTLL